MDGTLIDSTGDGNRCWSRWADEWSIEDRSFTETYHGVPARQTLATIVPADRVEAAFQRIIEVEVEDTTGITVLPGAVDFFQSLPSSRRAIVTSSSRPVTLAHLRAAGIAVPDTLITSELTPRGKPLPEPFLAGAAALGLDPATVAVIEDTPAGIAAGKAAGCTVVGVLELHERSALASADFVIASLEAISLVPSDGPDLILRVDSI